MAVKTMFYTVLQIFVPAYSMSYVPELGPVLLINNNNKSERKPAMHHHARRSSLSLHRAAAESAASVNTPALYVA